MRKRRLDLYECEVSPRTRWSFVRLETADDLVGFGECSDAGSRAAVIAAFADTARRFFDLTGDLLEVTDPGATPQISAAAVAAAGGQDIARRTVVGGIEQAFCDVAARRAGEPLWKWLGGAAGSSVPLYANVNRVVGERRPEHVAATGGAAVATGFTAVKCAPFDVPLDHCSLVEAGLARLRALRDAVGPATELLVDCHERLTLEDIVRIVPDLEDLGVTWLEDATACTDLAGLSALRDATVMSLAGGELASAPEQVLPAVEAELLDVVMPDVKHAAGLMRALEIGRAVPAAQLSPHNPSGPIGTAVSAHLGAALPNFTVLEYAYGETRWRADLVGGAEVVEGGRLQMPDGLGLGLDLNTDHPSLVHVSSLTI